MRRFCIRAGVGLALLLIALGAFLPAAGQAPALPSACGDLAFSVEQTFMTRGPDPPDNNSIISDGDLLGPNCIVCARNRDLLRQFDVNPDLGLDAVDVVSTESYLVAFSTELDSPNKGQFSAGDLLITNGSVIANVALVHGFGVGYDVGLDAVHFVGDIRGILGFLNEVRQFRRSDWFEQPGALAGMLRQWQIDIWFSTEEGFVAAARPGFIDGDLLSARDGTIVAANQALLPASVPAGIPLRGVDFGLDAATAARLVDAKKPETIRFSTELLFVSRPGFTDGDVIGYGDGVVVDHVDLIKCFEPEAPFLGLDALSAQVRGRGSLIHFQLILKQFARQRAE